jgi:LEA14-like dessication related protein
MGLLWKLSAISGVLLLAACAGVGEAFKAPEVHLDRVVLRGLDLTGGVLDLQLGVLNPNRFDLQGTKLQVGFDVQDSHVGDIEYRDEFQVQKGDTTALTLPLRFNWSGVSGAVRSALGQGALPYTLKGQLTLRTPFGPRVVPFTTEGRAPLTRLGGLIPIPTGQ